MQKTKIEWTGHTWNPIRGTKGRWHCTKVSDGCKNCYAERLNIRFGGPAYLHGADTLRLDEKILRQPISMKKPRMIFVCSMTDLFHEQVSLEWTNEIFDIMGRQCPQHTFQVLTKRPERMRYFLKNQDRVYNNVWIGASVEDQETANARIPVLLSTPATVRWLSMEPLLGQIKLNDRKPGEYTRDCLSGEYWMPGKFIGNGPKVDWVVVGGESGHRARPMKVEWARLILQQCKEASVPFFFKHGSQANWPDFKNFDSFPSVLQVREHP